MTQQKGMTTVTMLFVVMIAALLILVAIKIIPVYMENLSVVSSLESLSVASKGKGYSDSELRSLLGKRFQINNIDRVDPNDLEISNDEGVLVLNLDYEVRTSFIANIDFVLSFSEQAEIEDR